MKNSFRLSVLEPCSENFANFKKTKQGGYCNSCQKEVIDFTELSDLEVVQHFKKNNGSTCGRFRTSQLKNYEFESVGIMNTNIFQKSLGIASFSLLALCATAPVQSQEVAEASPIMEMVISQKVGNEKFVAESYTVRGTVLDETNLPLPGVNVILKGTSIGTTTDYDGKFEFPQKLEVNDVLVFSYIGYDTKEYKVVPAQNDTIDITIVFDATDIELMGDVVVGGAYKSKRNIFQKFIALFK
ncbi:MULTISPECIES: carboxypeptidase-like regulatory domain-containing protein [Maribacter]|uniref:Carboxypeptidase-like regulatory domain-containing protein n=1 Tax=Maribacter flavus TaxID=1658664 RepID=A0ABU7IH17_9FLAO|nr:MULTISPECIES: carboxypeptidase-like regulatory domain-containing protein [Maribacter]MDC6404828.1 carboxypeptidase-like regulatory domain-containing protein [Maribacter sp. PR66]MEE1972242.1 carboxypeptidase-like regulatory domain-containing protein [Maribacter flavus]